MASVRGVRAAGGGGGEASGGPVGGDRDSAQCQTMLHVPVALITEKLRGQSLEDDHLKVTVLFSCLSVGGPAVHVYTIASLSRQFLLSIDWFVPLLSWSVCFSLAHVHLSASPFPAGFCRSVCVCVCVCGCVCVCVCVCV